MLAKIQKWRCRYEKNNSNYKVSYIRNGCIIVYSINTDSKRYIEYRIKPEPKYRPFANAEECWAEMLKHQPFGWIKCKEGYFNIVYVDDYYVGLADPDGSSISLASKNGYQDNTFADGTPFGIKS